MTSTSSTGPPLDRLTLARIVRSLGYDPDRVIRVTLFPDRVAVDLVTQTVHGVVSRTEIRPVIDG